MFNGFTKGADLEIRHQVISTTLVHFKTATVLNILGLERSINGAT